MKDYSRDRSESISNCRCKKARLSTAVMANYIRMYVSYYRNDQLISLQFQLYINNHKDWFSQNIVYILYIIYMLKEYFY